MVLCVDLYESDIRIFWDGEIDLDLRFSCDFLRYQDNIAQNRQSGVLLAYGESMVAFDIRSSQIKSVGHQPLDASIYGFCSCAGNIREWCLDKFGPNGLPIAENRLIDSSQDEPRSMNARSFRGGSFGNVFT